MASLNITPIPYAEIGAMRGQAAQNVGNTLGKTLIDFGEYKKLMGKKSTAIKVLDEFRKLGVNVTDDKMWVDLMVSNPDKFAKYTADTKGVLDYIAQEKKRVEDVTQKQHTLTTPQITLGVDTDNIKKAIDSSVNDMINKYNEQQGIAQAGRETTAFMGTEGGQVEKVAAAAKAGGKTKFQPVTEELAKAQRSKESDLAAMQRVQTPRPAGTEKPPTHADVARLQQSLVDNRTKVSELNRTYGNLVDAANEKKAKFEEWKTANPDIQEKDYPRNVKRFLNAEESYLKQAEKIDFQTRELNSAIDSVQVQIDKVKEQVPEPKKRPLTGKGGIF